MALRKRHIPLIAILVLLASCRQRVDQAGQIRAASTISVEKLKRGLVNHHRDFTNKYAEIMRDVAIRGLLLFRELITRRGK